MLPHVMPCIWLSSQLAKTLELMIETGAAGITVDNLAWNRIDDPAATLEKLVKGGAVIHMVMRRSLTPYRSDFKDTPHYVFKGWIQ